MRALARNYPVDPAGKFRGFNKWGTMNKILEKEFITPTVFRMKVEAPVIAQKRRAGQFIILRTSESGERIPLTIADADPEEGWILEPGEFIHDLVGPLGKPTHIELYGTVVIVGGGIGIAPSHPIAQAMKAAGNNVICILGGRTKELVIMEEKMRATSDRVVITTDDGSYGMKGLVTDALQQLIDEGVKIDLVVAIGPPIMMKFVSLLTKKFDIPTLVPAGSLSAGRPSSCASTAPNSTATRWISTR